MDELKQQLVNQMKSHCEAGMRFPEGDSPQNTLLRKKRLLYAVSHFDGPEDFLSARDLFVLHVTMFEGYHKLKGESKCQNPHADLAHVN